MPGASLDDDVDLAVAELGAAIAAATALGWRPVDVVRAVTANGTPAQARLVAAVVEGGEPALLRWRRRYRGADDAALTDALVAVVVVRKLPAIPFVTEASAAVGVDAGVLARVRALLAKAESTTFEAEATALVAKAQELVVRHALDEALATDGAASSAADRVVARRVLLDQPYVRAKFSLLARVARASSCRALLSTAFDFATVFGHPSDLDAVELLYTSLLLQATGGVAAARPPGRSAPSSSVAAYRRSWLLSYAQRVGERLDEARRSAVAEVEAERGSMALVLAARTDAVDEAVREAAPDAKTLRARASSAAGWAAGRAAGDRARLDHRTPLPPEQPALGWHDPAP